MCISLPQHCFAYCLPTSIYSVYRILYSVCLLCSTAVVLYSSNTNVFFLWSLQHSDLGWSVCLPMTLCCLLVYHCMFRTGRVDVDGGSDQVRRGCMVNAGRSVFWCPLMGAESDSCGRNGRWKGLIFRHNRVHVQNEGAVLRKSSPRGVYPAHFPARHGKNVRRPISSDYFTLDVNRYPVVSPNDQGAPCCVVYPYFIFIFIFSGRKNPSYRDSNSRPNVSEGYKVFL